MFFQPNQILFGLQLLFLSFVPISCTHSWEGTRYKLYFLFAHIFHLERYAEWTVVFLRIVLSRWLGFLIQKLTFSRFWVWWVRAVKMDWWEACNNFFLQGESQILQPLRPRVGSLCRNQCPQTCLLSSLLPFFPSLPMLICRHVLLTASCSKVPLKNGMHFFPCCTNLQ